MINLIIIEYIHLQENFTSYGQLSLILYFHYHSLLFLFFLVMFLMMDVMVLVIL